MLGEGVRDVAKHGGERGSTLFKGGDVVYFRVDAPVVASVVPHTRLHHHAVHLMKAQKILNNETLHR